MTDEEIDKLSRASFRNSRAANEAKLWSDMEKILDERGSKGGGFYWPALGAVVLVVATALGWFVISDTSKSIITPTEDQIVENQKTINPESNANDIDSKSDQPIRTEELQGNDAKPLTKSISKTAIKQEKPIEATSKTNVEKASILNEESTPQNGEALLVASVTQPVDTKPEEENNLSLITEMSAGQTINKVSKVNEANENSVGLETSQSIEEETPESVEITNSEQGANQEDNSIALVDVSAIENPQENSEQKVDVQEDSQETMAIAEGEIKADEPINTETEFGEELNSNSRIRFFVQPRFSYFNSEKEKEYYIETTSSNSHINTSRMKDWSAGIDAGVQFNKFYIKTGLHYQELNQSFSIRTQTTEIIDNYEYEDRLIGTEIVQSGTRYEVFKVPVGSGFSYRGQSIAIYDTNDVFVTDTIINKTELVVETQSTLSYTLKYFQVPLMVGYEHVLGARWLIDVSGGINLGILAGQSGSTFNNNSEEVVSLLGSSHPSKTTVSYLVNVGVGYMLGPDMSINLTPSYKYLGNGPFNYSESQRSFYGVDLGLRYKF
ncbi:MAG: hypothetical protein CL840_06890 [Crocinitomicaceae bacterium]|nr:hypothetical protein [Crocinitomicaceae bacterium]|tara:strand:+ start:1985 stop:3643 length:1659 start_codon:yes stop_codon:yes gene_type:complete